MVPFEQLLLRLCRSDFQLFHGLSQPLGPGVVVFLQSLVCLGQGDPGPLQLVFHLLVLHHHLLHPPLRVSSSANEMVGAKKAHEEYVCFGWRDY